MQRTSTIVLAAAVVALAMRAAAAPAPIRYATYLGGTHDEADALYGGVVAMAVDGAGNVYLAGGTRSPDFPTTPGAPGHTLWGEEDGFVTKLAPDGTVVWSTYLGGPCDDVVRDVAVDAAGAVYVTGRAHGGVCQEDVTAGVLVAQLDAGGTLLHAYVLGASLADTSIGQAIAVDGAGNAYVTGLTGSSSHDFPVTAGAWRTQDCAAGFAAGADGFVAKLDMDAATLVWSTFLCGTSHDSPNDLAVDATGAVYVVGATESRDFPVIGALQDVHRGGPTSVTGFVTKLGANGTRLVWSTYLGGTTNDAIGGVALDAQANVYVAGETESSDLPTTPGVVQPAAGNRLCIASLCSDAFVASIDASGGLLRYATYLFGEGDDAATRITVDDLGHAHVVGTTSSTNFPLMRAFQPRKGTLGDAFVVELNADATRLIRSSYLGGSAPSGGTSSGSDAGSAIALDPSKDVWVAGYTSSQDFPATPNAFQPALAQGVCDVASSLCGDAFVARIAADAPRVVPAVDVTGTPSEVAPNGTLVASWRGVPAPSPSDQLRLYALGDLGADYDEVASAPTHAAAEGRTSLAIPGDVPTGWYELRLLAPDPALYGVLVAIARSEPILVTRTPNVACDALACDDGDPCTADACVPGAGCTSAPADVACTCRRAVPACIGEPVPKAAARRQQRACGLLDATPRGARLRKAAKLLNRSLHLVAAARRLSGDCTAALTDQLRDVRDDVRRQLGR